MLLSAPSKFTSGYKKEIVRLITELGEKPTEVAQDIGVTATTVRRWVKQLKENGESAFPLKGNLTPEDEERRKMLKRVQDLEEENAILKKAMGIFSKDAR